MLKSIFKKIFFPLLSLFLVFQTWELMALIRGNQPDSFSLFQTCSLAFLLTLYVTGIWAFLGFAFPTSRILPPLYYFIKSPKKLSFWMQIGGVKYFRWALLFFFWGRGKNRQKFFNGTKKGIKNFLFQTKQSEFGHLASFVFIVILSVPLAFEGYFRMVITMALLNLIGNVYPIILQRHHRLRLKRFIKLDNNSGI